MPLGSPLTAADDRLDRLELAEEQGHSAEDTSWRRKEASPLRRGPPIASPPPPPALSGSPSPRPRSPRAAPRACLRSAAARPFLPPSTSSPGDPRALGGAGR